MKRLIFALLYLVVWLVFVVSAYLSGEPVPAYFTLLSVGVCIGALIEKWLAR